jgi:hypothetical protein
LGKEAVKLLIDFRPLSLTAAFDQNTPRFRRRLVNVAKKPSTALIYELVGVRIVHKDQEKTVCSARRPPSPARKGIKAATHWEITLDSSR